MDTVRQSLERQQPPVKVDRPQAKPAWRRPTVTRISMKSTMAFSFMFH
jgi:hypothetical protein